MCWLIDHCHAYPCFLRDVAVAPSLFNWYDSTFRRLDWNLVCLVCLLAVLHYPFVGSTRSLCCNITDLRAGPFGASNSKRKLSREEWAEHGEIIERMGKNERTLKFAYRRLDITRPTTRGILHVRSVQCMLEGFKPGFDLVSVGHSKRCLQCSLVPLIERVGIRLGHTREAKPKRAEKVLGICVQFKISKRFSLR